MKLSLQSYSCCAAVAALVVIRGGGDPWGGFFPRCAAHQMGERPPPTDERNYAENNGGKLGGEIEKEEEEHLHIDREVKGDDSHFTFDESSPTGGGKNVKVGLPLAKYTPGYVRPVLSDKRVTKGEAPGGENNLPSGDPQDGPPYLSKQQCGASFRDNAKADEHPSEGSHHDGEEPPSAAPNIWRRKKKNILQHRMSPTERGQEGYPPVEEKQTHREASNSDGSNLHESNFRGGSSYTEGSHQVGQLKLRTNRDDQKMMKGIFTPQVVRAMKEYLLKGGKKYGSGQVGHLGGSSDQQHGGDRRTGSNQAIHPLSGEAIHPLSSEAIHPLRFFPANFAPHSGDSQRGAARRSIINEKLRRNLSQITLSVSAAEERTKERVEEGAEVGAQSVAQSGGADDGEAGALRKIYKGVVKLYVDITEPSLETIWSNSPPKRVSGSGFVIEGGLILTNAHNVAYSTRILVRKHGCSKKYEAAVLHVAHEADMALLTVADGSFYEDVSALELGPLPSLRDDVITVGYPSGGDKLSVTKGIVSRIEVQYYRHSNSRLLLTQIDAPMNPGNSGGPALVKGKVAGICFQLLKMANNTSYIIPTPVIKHFLMDLHRSGKYNGYPSLGVKYLPLDNDNLRRLLGLTDLERRREVEENSGILVTEVDEEQMGCQSGGGGSTKWAVSSGEASTGAASSGEASMGAASHAITAGRGPLPGRPPITPTAPAEPLCYGLKKNDVLLSVEGTQIKSDGTVTLRGDESVDFQFLFNGKFVGDLCTCRVVRGGRVQTALVRVSRVHYLVRQHNWDVPNKFFIYGGVVFTTLTRSLYADEETDNVEVMRLLQFNLFKKQRDDEIVIVKRILPSKLTIGFNYQDCIVLTVNGIPVRNLQHLVGVIDGREGPLGGGVAKKSTQMKQMDQMGERRGTPSEGDANPYLKFTLEEDPFFQMKEEKDNLLHFLLLTSNGQQVPLVLLRAEVQRESAEIRRVYGITRERYVYSG
ncbi:serine protease DegP, putative [Plasmodium vivax]|uniref:Serine protease DegP, putative n=1 Tax=Plasmodium vivax TaxID=5855 RepID=A0A1G4GR00_PLAVI|nr:serine protease DegP, putative [Plasmodium vivax]